MVIDSLVLPGRLEELHDYADGEFIGLRYIGHSNRDGSAILLENNHPIATYKVGKVVEATGISQRMLLVKDNDYPALREAIGYDAQTLMLHIPFSQITMQPEDSDFWFPLRPMRQPDYTFAEIPGFRQHFCEP